MRPKCLILVLYLPLLAVSGYSISADIHTTTDSSLSFAGVQEKNETTGEFGLTQETYGWKYDFSESNEEIINRANGICKGLLYVDTNISEPYVANLDAIDWDVSFTTSPGTFSLYLLALNPVAYLTQAYYLTGDFKYLDCARKIVEQWIAYKNSDNGKKNPYLWYDHGTAIRANNLIYFLLAYNDGMKLNWGGV